MKRCALTVGSQLEPCFSSLARPLMSKLIGFGNNPKNSEVAAEKMCPSWAVGANYTVISQRRNPNVEEIYDFSLVICVTTLLSDHLGYKVLVIPIGIQVAIAQ